ncbi:hypothetical protein N7527_008043 [Penicillium freii]|nr:hypothetical protein N7527_008043 [Penicillium freii]
MALRPLGGTEWSLLLLISTDSPIHQNSPIHHKSHAGTFWLERDIITYMAMVQANRKARGQLNWSVWGCLSGGWGFQLYFLDLEQSSPTVSSANLGWQKIANTLSI